MVLAIATGHLDLMLVAEHANLLEPLVRAPDNQRHLEPHRGLYREDALPGEDRPINAAGTAQAGPRDPLYRLGVHVLHENVAIEADAEVREIANAERRVEILIVSDEQRVEPEAL